MHGFDVTIHVETGGFGGEEFGTEVLSLLAHGLGECAARGAAHARIVDDFVGDGDLAAEIVLFENQHAVASAGQVQAGRQASRPATNDDDVSSDCWSELRKLPYTDTGSSLRGAVVVRLRGAYRIRLALASTPPSRFQRQLPSERGAKVTAYSVSITAGRRGRGWARWFPRQGSSWRG